MSSPINVPRSPASGPNASPSSSPAALYVPVHKRAGSSSSGSPRAPLPSPASGQPTFKHIPPPSRTGQTASPMTPSCSQTGPYQSVQQILDASPQIPVRSEIPFIYSISDLLALASSPKAALSPEKLESVRKVLPGPAAPRPSRGETTAAVRQRPTGRKGKILQRAVSTGIDAQTLRRQRGTWNWHSDSLAVLNQQGWRHGGIVGVGA